MKLLFSAFDSDIYIHVCVCVCVCLCNQNEMQISRINKETLIHIVQHQIKSATRKEVGWELLMGVYVR